MFIDFDSSINTKSVEYEKCISGKDYLYLRSMPDSCTPKEYINFAKNLYNKNVKLLENPKKTSNIPKVIHQIWFGSQFPEEYKEFQKSFIEKNPSWDYILWDLQSFESVFKPHLHSKKIYNSALQSGNYAQVADIARYEIIYKLGGLYVDCDTQCLKPFDGLNASFDFYVGLENLVNGLVVGNALIGSIPGHPILKDCLNKIKEYEDKDLDFSSWNGISGYSRQIEEHYAKTLVITGPILFSRSIWKMADKSENKDIIFPSTYFFPWSEHKSYPIMPETVSCHYFKGLWKTKLEKLYK